MERGNGGVIGAKQHYSGAINVTMPRSMTHILKKNTHFSQLVCCQSSYAQTYFVSSSDLSLLGSLSMKHLQGCSSEYLVKMNHLK